jgi:hypothetical protein
MHIAFTDLDPKRHPTGAVRVLTRFGDEPAFLPRGGTTTGRGRKVRELLEHGRATSASGLASDAIFRVAGVPGEVGVGFMGKVASSFVLTTANWVHSPSPPPSTGCSGVSMAGGSSPGVVETLDRLAVAVKTEPSSANVPCPHPFRDSASRPTGKKVDCTVWSKAPYQRGVGTRYVARERAVVIGGCFEVDTLQRTTDGLCLLQSPRLSKKDANMMRYPRFASRMVLMESPKAMLPWANGQRGQIDRQTVAGTRRKGGGEPPRFR